MTTERIGGGVGAGYTACACRDCFDIAIGDPGNALCSECREAGCSNAGDRECDRPDAYGGCAVCGGNLVPGVNSDFCSEACEREHDAKAARS